MKKIIALALACMMLFSSSNLYVSAESTYDKLNKNQAEQEELDEKISELNDKINTVEEKINLANEKIEEINKESEKLQEEIDGLISEIEENEEDLGKRLKVINNNYGLGYLKIILSSDSISEFLNNIYIVQEIISQDKQLLMDLENNKNKIEENKTALVKKQEEEKEIQESLLQDKEGLEADKLELDELKAELVKEEEELEEKLRELAASGSSNVGAVISNGSWPVPGYSTISSPYGYRIHPVLGVKKFHTGIDIPAPTGTPVVSVSGGKVIFSGVQGAYGNTVMVQHDNGLVSLYAHNSALCVKVGDRVEKGQLIAKIGSTGRSTGPHLHFEIRVNGSHQNPLSYI